MQKDLEIYKEKVYGAETILLELKRTGEVNIDNIMRKLEQYGQNFIDFFINNNSNK